MAINPNVTFVAGDTFTAGQANRFPRGIVAYNADTSTDSTITSEEVEITVAAFTAVADRLYRITYYEPGFGSSVAAGMTMRVRLTNISGPIQQSGIVYNTGIQQQSGCLIGYSTFSAGSVVLVGTLQNSTGTGSANRSSTAFSVLSVEDVGPI
jgi:hypothetical protein